MRKLKIYSAVLAFTLLSYNEGFSQKTKTGTPSKYKYETVAGDQLGAKIYTLKNGLKVYMSVYKDAPRIQTYIAARTGSRNDPADATGLAHYLEHMLFKGTSKIGALDWEKEKPMLKQISDLYEKHRAAKPEDRAAIYAEIDKLSNEAAKFVSANEYDRMISGLGADGTNAYTSFDQTVYVNDIPSNELEKWMQVESERFRELVLRLFHTELEAVYEEFNINQNRDGRKLNQAFLSSLIPNHPYGTQTTIGTGEHLKTPSMVKIHEYFDKYYVPNNMAIVLAGDFDPDKAIALVEKYFGDYKNKDVPKFVVQPQPEIKAPIIKEVLGKEKALVDIGWLTAGVGSDEAMLASLASSIVSNGKAGLMDLNLVQKQKIAEGSYCFNWALTDFGFFGLYGYPRQGQTLEEVKDLMLAQLDDVRKGKFEDWMIEAVINDMEYSAIKQRENNASRGDVMLDAFIHNQSWESSVKYFERLRKFTKKDIVDFVNKKIRPENCVIIYKREGEDKDIYKVDKPKITELKLNREAASKFKGEFDKAVSPALKPAFIDYKTAIKTTTLASKAQLKYTKNPDNKTFMMYTLVDIGTENDKTLPIAMRYLKYLGTDKYSPEQLQIEMFKLGISFDVFTAGDVSYLMLTGLDRSHDKGVELMEHILTNAKPNADALKNLVSDIKKERVDAKKNKNYILGTAMRAFGQYGENSPFKFRLSESELDKLTAEQLVDIIKKITSYQHEVFYYGSRPQTEVVATLNKYKKVAAITPCPKPANYAELATTENKVIFVNFSSMTQAEIMFLSKGTPQFDSKERMMNNLYNTYFGSGLSSIVFQEIREAKALAYSAYAFNGSPAYKDRAHYYRAFVGTQTDKMPTAIPAMFEIINNMPVVEEQIKNAHDAVLKNIESERITKEQIYFTDRSNKKLGISVDSRKETYDYFKKYSNDTKGLVAELKKYQETKVKDRKYTILVLGDKSKLDLEYLKKLGTFQEMTIDEIFGY